MTNPTTLNVEGIAARTVESLTRLERKWLSRRECAWCGHLLHHSGCSAIWEGCTEEQADQRRGAALATYKPRAALLKEQER